jgi:hypothetical protein
MKAVSSRVFAYDLAPMYQCYLLAMASRDRNVRFGASPRAARTMILAGKIHAVLAGRMIGRKSSDMSCGCLARSTGNH